MTKKLLLYCIAIPNILFWAHTVHASFFEKIFRWTLVSCNTADSVERDGIQKFYSSRSEGIEILKKVSESCINNEEYTYNLGVAYYRTGKTEKAVAMFKEAVRLRRNFTEAKRALSWTLVIGKVDVDGGMDISMDLLKKENDSLLMYIVGYAYKIKGDDSKWKEWFQKAKKRVADQNKLNREKYDHLLEEAKKEPFLDERIPILYTEIGLLFERMWNYEKAKEYFMKANSSYGWWSLGRMYARSGDPQSAKEYLTMALDFSAGLEDGEIKVIKEDMKNSSNPLYFYDTLLPFIYPEEVVFIPSGEFTMGRADGQAIEQPEHSVYFDSFLLGKYEVTNTEYKIYIDSTGHVSPYNCCKAKYDTWNKVRIPSQMLNTPVVNVSWYDVVRYIGWKNRRFGKNYRLPTEAEWEKAARGTDGRLYPWGNTSPTLEVAYFSRHWDGLNTFVAVDSYTKGVSPYGIHHMAGSVWEWCYDWFRKDYYKKGPQRDLKGPYSGEFKVLRGGSWMNLSGYITTTFRNRHWPDARYNGVGFRLAADM